MPRKGENIYKRKDGRWEARYIKQRTPGGKAVYGYVYAKSYKEAKSKVQKCLIAVANSCATSSIQIKRSPQEMRVLSRGEQERLCKYLYSNLSACNIGILVSLFTGIRIGELCALKWEDISLQEQTIHISQTMQRIQDRSGVNQKTKIVVTSPKSVCSIRTIPLPGHLVKILAEYKAADAGFLLTNSTVRYIEPRTMQNKFQKALKHSSIESVNFHALRHTFATRCVELGLINPLYLEEQVKKYLFKEVPQRILCKRFSTKSRISRYQCA